MDMSLVMAALTAKAGAIQTQVATAVLKSNLDAEKSTVQTLLGTGGPSAPSSANLGAGIGGSLDVSA